LIDALHFQNTIELLANHRHYPDGFYPLDTEVILSHFHGFAALEERGHHYEFYLASRQGLIIAEYVNRQVKGGSKTRTSFSVNHQQWFIRSLPSSISWESVTIRLSLRIST
jgi:hypothetical protein